MHEEPSPSLPDARAVRSLVGDYYSGARSDIPLGVAHQRWSLRDYATIADENGPRIELFDGRLSLTPFERLPGIEHATIVVNFAVALMNAVGTGSDVRVFMSSLKLRILGRSTVRLPDVTVIRGAIRRDVEDDSPAGSVVNPEVIVEVIDECSEALDWGAKRLEYMTIESLKEYVLISQERPEVETFLRQSDGSWRYERFGGIDGVVLLRSLEIELKLADVFAGVSFPDASPLAQV